MRLGSLVYEALLIEKFSRAYQVRMNNLVAAHYSKLGRRAFVLNVRPFSSTLDEPMIVAEKPASWFSKIEVRGSRSVPVTATQPESRECRHARATQEVLEDSAAGWNLGMAVSHGDHA